MFCRIVAGTAPATIVRRWEDAVAFVPLGPVVDMERGHVLVVPHVPAESPQRPPRRRRPRPPSSAASCASRAGT